MSEILKEGGCSLAVPHQSLSSDVAVQVSVRGEKVTILTVNYSLVAAHGLFKVPKLSV
jgi:hypothetical protein